MKYKQMLPAVAIALVIVDGVGAIDQQAQANEGLFGMTEFAGNGTLIAEGDKCGSDKCGKDKKDHDKKGADKCGSDKCGKDKKDHDKKGGEDKCGAGSCGSDK